jgi:lipopolysaccharide/colanic/teichoic acid biosynthesis glycosyltransferase
MAWTKRLFDLLAASLGLILLSPAMLLLALLVRLLIGPPILFWQQRPGYRGRPFHIVKFRTMTETRDAAGQPLPDSVRVTSFGRWMRLLSLDELPELYNILRGEMSVVGPRPLLMEYLPLYSPQQMRRHEVHPGLTGWAQINGRNTLDWPERFQLDVWYVDHWSLWLDIKIIVITLWKALTREGVNQPGSATTDFFRGTRD